MSFTEATEALCTACEGSIALSIEPREKDLGEFSVRRVLPARERQMVGPFIFFDHMGPAVFGPGKGIQVRPHPHIGLATITYLFEGEIRHRDSLGFVQPIRPGAVNLMTAGRGIVHSERAGEDLDRNARLHGIQSWMALPEALEEMAPAFQHFPADGLPELSLDGVVVRVIMGRAFGAESPVPAHSPTLYLACELTAGATLSLPRDHEEMAAYVVEGRVRIDDASYASGVMAVAAPDRSLVLTAEADSRVMVIGGEPLGERHLYWNFVSSSLARIDQAKADWRENRFDPVPGETEFIPLPD